MSQEESFVLTVKEPYATGLVTGVILAYVHKLKLTGKKLFVCVATDKDLNEAESADVFAKLGDAPLTAEFYKGDLSEDVLAERLQDIAARSLNGETVSEDEALFALLAGAMVDDENHLGKIIGWVKFDEATPMSTRFKNFLGEYELFPESEWKAHKGSTNLVPYAG